MPWQKNLPKLTLVLVILIMVFSGNLGNTKVAAQASDDKLQKLQSEIEQYQKEIDRLRSQASTLANQIAQYDAQIKLTSLKISETQEKIELLGGRINRLEVSLTALSDAFTSRATETYKMTRLNEPVLSMVSAGSVDGAFSRFFYLQKIQEADRDLLVKLQSAQSSYMEEKESQEDLQKS